MVIKVLTLSILGAVLGIPCTCGQHVLQSSNQGGVATAAAASTNLAAGSVVPVPEKLSTAYPFSAVGQLANGCVGFLIGPCHVMTVAHCVVEPWRMIWWRGLDFYPGRNVDLTNSSAGWSPLGKATKADVVVHPNWTDYSSGMQGKPAADAAIIITKQPVGKQLGWLDFNMPQASVIQTALELNSFVGNKTVVSALNSALPANTAAAARSQVQQQQEDMLNKVGQGPPSGQLMDGLVSAAGLSLHVVGYPDNKPNGSMWEQCCSKLDWQLQGNLLWHNCIVRGGNSGSPVWVVWPTHTARDSHVSTSKSGGKLFTKQNGSNNTYNASSMEASNKDQQHTSSSTGHFQVVGVHTASLKYSKDSPTGVFAATMYERVAQDIIARAAEGGASGVSVVGTCVSGANGREADGENVLLPVAVPFTGDTYSWIEQVLEQNVCSND